MGFMHTKFRAVGPARLEDRAEPRRPVLLQRATVRPSTAPPMEARLVDLSIYGCRLMISCRMKVGVRITLRFSDAEPVAATAMWCDGKHIGCRFDQPIDAKLFRSLTLSVN